MVGNALYVFGGRQRRHLARPQEEWHLYEQAVILRVDVEAGTAETCLTYDTPPEARPEGVSSVFFKASSVRNRTLYTCTGTEVLIYEIPTFRPRGYVSLPCLMTSTTCRRRLQATSWS